VDLTTHKIAASRGKI